MHYKDTNINTHSESHKVQKDRGSTVFIQTLIVYYDFLDLILRIMRNSLRLKNQRENKWKLKATDQNTYKHPSKSSMGGRW